MSGAGRRWAVTCLSPRTSPPGTPFGELLLSLPCLLEIASHPSPLPLRQAVLPGTSGLGQAPQLGPGNSEVRDMGDSSPLPRHIWRALQKMHPNLVCSCCYCFWGAGRQNTSKAPSYQLLLTCRPCRLPRNLSQQAGRAGSAKTWKTWVWVAWYTVGLL